MTAFYTCLTITCIDEYRDILLAEISELGFDTFQETENGFEAYAEGDDFQRDELQGILDHYMQVAQLSSSFSKVEKQNWNEEWEKNFPSILVEDKCLVRAHFHEPDPSIPFEILITPKMSFGTGHHQTTYLMLKTMLQMDFMGKRVLDAGCGTGILAIMAYKKGSQEVEAFDIDPWCKENGEENASLNGITTIPFHLGTINEVQLEGKFDIILANINKNVLEEDIPSYFDKLNSKGFLLLSGFFEQDSEDLLAAAKGFTEILRDSRDNWACILLKKDN